MRRYLTAYLRSLLLVGGRSLGLTVALIAATSLSEGLSVALLLPLLQVAGLAVQQDNLGLTRFLSHAFHSVGLRPSLLPLLLLFVAVTGGQALLRRWQTLRIFHTEQEFVLHLRRRLTQAITYAEWRFLCRRRSSDFVHAVAEEAGRFGETTFVVLSLAADLFVGVVLIALAALLSPVITATVVAAGVFLLAVHQRIVRAIKDDGDALSAAMKSFYAATIEQFQSLKTVKTYSAEDRTIAMIAADAASVSDAYMRISRRQAGAGVWFEMGTVLLLCLILSLAVLVLALPAATILTLLVLFWKLMPRFMSGHQSLRNLVSMLAAFATVVDLTEECERAAETQSQAAVIEDWKTLRFHEVSFAYGEQQVLQSVNFSIEAGSWVALTGASGGGKSTLLDLAMGLLVADRGTIAVDDAPLTADRFAAWRRLIGFVGPETALLHRSVRENLLWACPDASEAELWKALRLAAADEFVAELPQGLDTLIGDRGALVSQGQAQRLALARALLRQPRLLILDEATNSLDAETEARIMRALAPLRPRMTLLLAAHRPATLRWADRVHFVEEGHLRPLPSGLQPLPSDLTPIFARSK